MDMRRRIDTMKLWLDELAVAYEIPDPDEATKAILTAIVKIQQRLAQHAAWAVETGWGDPQRRTTRASLTTELPCDLRDTSAETIARLRAMHLFYAAGDDQRKRK